MDIANWIQSIGILITLTGLIIVVLHNRKQLQVFNEQLKLNFFADYTKRYQEIILNLPDNISQSDFDYSKLQDEVRSKTMRYMRAYFDLCSEEYDLWKAGYVHDRIWNNWKQGIEFAFSKKAVVEAWNESNSDTMYYPEFSKWINGVILDQQKPVGWDHDRFPFTFVYLFPNEYC